MKTIRVFDPAMCCSTGVCGPSVDPQLVRFAADLDWLKDQGVAVERFNLSQEPNAFAADVDVRSALVAGGPESLPLVKIEGEVKSSGTYPSREELAQWAGVADRLERPVDVTASSGGSEASACCGDSGCC